MAVGNEHGATAAGVGDYRRLSRVRKCFNVLPGQLAGAVKIPGMGMKRSTTSLLRRSVCRASIDFQHPGGGAIDASKQTLSNASFEQQYLLPSSPVFVGFRHGS